MAENEEKKVAPTATAAPAAPSEAKTLAPKANGGYNNNHGSFNHNPNNRFGGQGRGGNGHGRFGGRKEDMEYDEKVVKITKVAKTVKGGKRLRFTALTVIGDKKGKYGYGLGKSAEVPEAIKKSLSAAKRNMFHLEIVKGDTIAHPIIGEFGATKVFLKPAPEGTGLVAGGAVRAILELAGVRNIYSKIYGSRTQSNVVKATVNGLAQLKDYAMVQAVRYGKEVVKKDEAKKPAEEAPKAPEAK